MTTSTLVAVHEPGSLTDGNHEIDRNVYGPADDEVRLPSHPSDREVIRDETEHQLEAPRQLRQRKYHVLLRWLRSCSGNNEKTMATYNTRNHARHSFVAQRNLILLQERNKLLLSDVLARQPYG